MLLTNMFRKNKSKPIIRKTKNKTMILILTYHFIFNRLTLKINTKIFITII